MESLIDIILTYNIKTNIRYELLLRSYKISQLFKYIKFRKINNKIMNL